MAVREGLIRCAHPTGSLRLSKTQCVLSNPVEGSHRSLLRNIKQKSLNVSPGFLLKYGGEGGVRTLDTLSRIHTFQACSFSHSDTSPYCRRQRFALSTGANVGETDSSVNTLVSTLRSFSQTCSNLLISRTICAVFPRLPVLVLPCFAQDCGQADI